MSTQELSPDQTTQVGSARPHGEPVPPTVAVPELSNLELYGFETWKSRPMVDDYGSAIG